MLDFARFLDALGSDDGLRRGGVDLPDATVAALRGHRAYALAWFENWTRDGQPAGGVIPLSGPYPTSPDVEVSDFAAAGYARTGDESRRPDSVVPAHRPVSPGRSAGDAPWSGRRPGRAAVLTPIVEPDPLATPVTPTAGWYPSPGAPGDEQWWDGSRWTPDIRPLLRRRRGLARFLRR